MHQTKQQPTLTRRNRDRVRNAAGLCDAGAAALAFNYLRCRDWSEHPFPSPTLTACLTAVHAVAECLPLLTSPALRIIEEVAPNENAVQLGQTYTLSVLSSAIHLMATTPWRRSQMSVVFDPHDVTAVETWVREDAIGWQDSPYDGQNLWDSMMCSLKVMAHLIRRTWLEANGYSFDESCSSVDEDKHQTTLDNTRDFHTHISESFDPWVRAVTRATVRCWLPAEHDPDQRVGKWNRIALAQLDGALNALILPWLWATTETNEQRDTLHAALFHNKFDNTVVLQDILTRWLTGVALQTGPNSLMPLEALYMSTLDAVLRRLPQAGQLCNVLMQRCVAVDGALPACNVMQHGHAALVVQALASHCGTCIEAPYMQCDMMTCMQSILDPLHSWSQDNDGTVCTKLERCLSGPLRLVPVFQYCGGGSHDLDLLTEHLLIPLSLRASGQYPTAYVGQCDAAVLARYGQQFPVPDSALQGPCAFLLATDLIDSLPALERVWGVPDDMVLPAVAAAGVRWPYVRQSTWSAWPRVNRATVCATLEKHA